MREPTSSEMALLISTKRGSRMPVRATSTFQDWRSSEGPQSSHQSDFVISTMNRGMNGSFGRLDSTVIPRRS